MKVLTIKQPFASLISEGIKEYEFRTWKTNYRGEILIHAGKSVNKKAMKEFDYLNLSYPKGMIIAKVNIADCVEVDDEFKNNHKEKVYEKSLKNYKGYAFKLSNVQKIKPVKASGKLSFWEYDEEIEYETK